MKRLQGKNGQVKEQPTAIASLPETIRLKYIIDLLDLEDGFMLLQNGSYYSFSVRDERISSILTEIFHIYNEPVDKDILMRALTTSLTHRFMTEKSTIERAQKIYLVTHATNAFDEFCRKTVLLEDAPNQKRKPGESLLLLLKDHKSSGVYKSQGLIVKAIKKFGTPVDSTLFGKIYREELKLPQSHKSVCYSYPVLFYKEGHGRKNDYYKTLDGIYGVSDGNTDPFNKSINKNKIDKIRQEINDLQMSLNALEEDDVPVGKIRKEQGLLRRFLIEISDGVKMSNGAMSCKCLMCNRYFAPDLLVAAHIKKRRDCSVEEKADIENIAMLQCGGCDKLFENGYVYIDDKGIIHSNVEAPLTDDVFKKIVLIKGNKTEYFNEDKSRIKYISHHREFSLSRHSKSEYQDKTTVKIE